MSSSPVPRPGGRSARVQDAVHKATCQLLDEQGRASVTVPMIAARAGVTPSTIYRRWGDVVELLADVAIERLRPDIGTRHWDDEQALHVRSFCKKATRRHLRAWPGARRAGSEVDAAMDRVVAPIVYRAMFGLPKASQADVRTWAKARLKDAADRPGAPSRSNYGVG